MLFRVARGSRNLISKRSVRKGQLKNVSYEIHVKSLRQDCISMIVILVVQSYTAKVTRTPSCVPHNMGSCCGGFEINSGYANSGYQLDVFCIFQRWYANSGYRPDCGCAKYAKVTIKKTMISAFQRLSNQKFSPAARWWSCSVCERRDPRRELSRYGQTMRN